VGRKNKRDFFHMEAVATMPCGFCNLRELTGDRVNLQEQITENPNFCFGGGTLVDTDHGHVPIKDLQVGDLVLSKNEDGTGELVYKPIIRTVVKEHVPVYYMCIDRTLSRSIPPLERIKLRKEGVADSVSFLITENHPLWVRDKGWIRADLLNPLEDNVLLSSKNHMYSFISAQGGGYHHKATQPIYKTSHLGLGFVPNYGDDNGKSGDYIDLATGTITDIGRTDCTEVLSKLFVHDHAWEAKLKAQQPESEHEGAEFHGFRQGYWVDPDTVEWGKGEGQVTTTVYNIEVADTHSYFVGKGGVWVHDNCRSQ
jgi:hypothetical protein